MKSYDSTVELKILSWKVLGLGFRAGRADAAAADTSAVRSFLQVTHAVEHGVATRRGLVESSVIRESHNGCTSMKTRDCSGAAVSDDGVDAGGVAGSAWDVPAHVDRRSHVLAERGTDAYTVMVAASGVHCVRAIWEVLPQPAAE